MNKKAKSIIIYLLVILAILAAINYAGSLLPQEKPINLAIVSNPADTYAFVDFLRKNNAVDLSCKSKESMVMYSEDVGKLKKIPISGAEQDKLIALCEKYGIADVSIANDYVLFSMLGPVRGYGFLEYYPNGISEAVRNEVLSSKEQNSILNTNWILNTPRPS